MLQMCFCNNKIESLCSKSILKLIYNKTNELLMKKHPSHLTNFTPFPKAHGKSFNHYEENNGQACGHGIDGCFRD